jgi:DNA mismatch repair protein MutL
VEAVTLLALARLDVAFRVVSDERPLLDAPRVAAVADRIAALFGRRTAEELIPVSHAVGAVSVRGFVQRPAQARPAGRKAHLFVNGRPFRDPFMVRAAEAGYRTTIHPGCRPTILLAIDLPGDAVDVNVHPSKLEVRFRDRYLVERAVEETVRMALRPMEAAVPAVAATFPGRPDADPAAESDPSWFEAAAAATQAPHPTGDALQVLATYLVFETPEGVAIVDQHSAHERILYERAMRHLTGQGTAAQHLLLPLTVELAPAELEAVESHADLLRAIGFEVEPFGGRSVVVHTVPNPHPRFDARRCFEEVVADLSRGRFGGWANRLERFAATYACRAAIMAGQLLDRAEIRELLARLMACELPPHDVHGRPTIVLLPRDELERRFGRS